MMHRMRCDECGDPFEAKAAHAMYCSEKCRLVAYKRQVWGVGEDINDFRRSVGLRPIQPAIVKCLRCDRKFRSPDKLRIRRCPACQNATHKGFDIGNHTQRDNKKIMQEVRNANIERARDRFSQNIERA